LTHIPEDGSGSFFSSSNLPEEITQPHGASIQKTWFFKMETGL
jgi:hypothetical protein